MQERDLLRLQKMSALYKSAVGVHMDKCRYCTGTCGVLEAPGVTSAWRPFHVPGAVHCVNLRGAFWMEGRLSKLHSPQMTCRALQVPSTEQLTWTCWTLGR